jgi:AraC-like DNA-binding protein
MKTHAAALGKDFFEPYNEASGDFDRLLPHLNIEAVSAAWFECSKRWSLKPRRINDSYWTRIISGRGRLRLGDENAEYSVGPGNFILFPQYSLHSLQPEPGTEMAMINVHFHARLYGILDMTAYCNLGGIYRDCELFDFNSREAAREYTLKPAGWRNSLAARIELVLIDLARKRGALPETAGKTSQMLRLQPLLNLIDSRLDKPDFGVTEIASEIGVSEVYLRVLFRRRLGVSPVKYLRRRRIGRACSLLKETALPIRLIAAECGFREVQFFHRVFRDITGVTPGNYRKNPDF